MKNSSINILIADDDKDDVSMLAEALQNILPSSHSISKPDGLAALNYIKSSDHLDLVFLDLNMPLRNGIDCLKDISIHNLLPNTPIVIYSTSKNEEHINIAYEYGAAFYIVKPESFIELSKIIKRAITILGKPKSERVDKSNFVLVPGRLS